MAQDSSIEWTDSTWNPLTGCTKVSPGCKNCYAERMAVRLRAMGLSRYRNGFRLTLHEDQLEQPLLWSRPRLVFVNSMSDLFHEDAPDAHVERVFAVMEKAHWHVFQILTKRADRLAAMAGRLPWPPNVWMGVSVETAAYLHRVDALRSVKSHVRFLSLEPLLGPLPRLDLRGIRWVILGGESGPGARPIQADWVRNIRDQCLTTNTPFFFKQWGGVKKTAAGRILDGRLWDERPPLAGDLTECRAGV